MLGWMCEEILIFFKGVKCYFTNLPLSIKKKVIIKWVVFI